MADYTLSVDITANDNASKTFQQIQENAKNFKSTVESAGEGMQNAGKKMTSVGNTLTKTVTTPIIGMGTATAKLASDFETSMAKVSTIADTSQVPIEDLQSAILDLSKETGVAASDIAESVYSAISAGQSTGDAVAFVTESTKLAKAGFTDAATSVDVLTTVMNAYGSSAGTAEEIANKLIQTQNLGKTTVNELGSSIGKVIPTANMFGVSLDNITSAYVTTTKNGIATAESTTYINSMLNELGKGGSTVSDILKEKTGKSFKELMDDGNSLTDVLGIVQLNGYSVATTLSGGKEFFILFDRDFKEIKRFGNHPVRGMTTEANDFMQLQGEMVSYKNSFYFASRFFGYLCRYDISDEEDVTLKWEKMLVEPVCNVYEANLARKKNNLDGFYGLTANDKYVFVTYSGELCYKAFENYSACTPKTLLGFSIDGELVGKYALEHQSMSVLLSQYTPQLYLLNCESECNVEIFEMDDILKAKL